MFFFLSEIFHLLVPTVLRSRRRVSALYSDERRRRKRDAESGVERQLRVLSQWEDMQQSNGTMRYGTVLGAQYPTPPRA